MAPNEERLARVESWLDRQNAQHDAIIKSRPAWWHAGKIVLGALFVAKSVFLGLNATGLGRYALALLFLAGGASLIYEGAKMLRERCLPRPANG